MALTIDALKLLGIVCLPERFKVMKAIHRLKQCALLTWNQSEIAPVTENARKEQRRTPHSDLLAPLHFCCPITASVISFVAQLLKSERRHFDYMATD